MRVLVTGATGFVGRHAVGALLQGGHQVLAVARDPQTARALRWFQDVNFLACDIHASDVAALVKDCDVLMHLAWHGLPNYKSSFHIERNLTRDLAFLKTALQAGIKHLVVTGTCLEYGSQRCGEIAEDAPSAPDVAYAIAKDSLRRFLEVLHADYSFVLQWVRLFYVHGEGQNPKSLLSQLDHALHEGKHSFDMSEGEQLRDFVSVSRVATVLAQLVEHPEITGCINCCSGKPISVRRFVEAYLAQRGAQISLNLGVYPYPDHEPLAFWGSSQKLSRLALSEDAGR